MFVATQWTCPQCATQDIGGEVCPNCGWHRDGTTGKVGDVSQSSLAEPFQLAGNESVFVLHRSNTNFVKGHIQRVGFRYTGWFLVMVVATTLLIAVVVSYLVREWNKVNVLDQSGIAVQATVVDHRTVSGKSTSYYLTYHFVVKGRIFEREQNVGSGTYYRFPLNAKVSVKYLASDPTVSLLAGDAADNSSLTSSTVVFGFFCISAFIATAYLGIKSLRYGRLSREGKLLRGRVVACTGSRGYKGSWFVSLCYSFRAPNGQITEKIEKEVRNDLRKQPLPRPGTPVAVLYVDEKLFEVM